MQTLNLAYDYTGDDGAKAIVDGLKHLQMLTLDNYHMTADGLNALDLYSALKQVASKRVQPLQSKDVPQRVMEGLAHRARLYGQMAIPLVTAEPQRVYQNPQKSRIFGGATSSCADSGLELSHSSGMGRTIYHRQRSNITTPHLPHLPVPSSKASFPNRLSIPLGQHQHHRLHHPHKRMFGEDSSCTGESGIGVSELSHSSDQTNFPSTRSSKPKMETLQV